MTTIGEIDKKCAICGKTSRHPVVISTNAFGSPDLDTRPPGMMRSTINMWIQICPSCGYCAEDISKAIEKASEVVHSEHYQRQLNNPEFPKVANAFLCFSLILENKGDYANAGWACVHAAWVCDDAKLDLSARKCRKRAVTLFQKAKENDQKFAEQSGAEEAMMVDLLRRSGQFDLALKICDDALKKKTEKIIADILHFQKILISKSDDSCHTIEEAIERNR